MKRWLWIVETRQKNQKSKREDSLQVQKVKLYEEVLHILDTCLLFIVVPCMLYVLRTIAQKFCLDLDPQYFFSGIRNVSSYDTFACSILCKITLPKNNCPKNDVPIPRRK